MSGVGVSFNIKQTELLHQKKLLSAMIMKDTVAIKTTNRDYQYI